MEDKMITTISVGEKFPLFNSPKNKPIVDGAILEALEEGDGYSYQIYLSNMTPKEKNAIATAKISAKVVVGAGGYVMTLFRFGSDKFIFEAEFDPTLYEDDRALQLVRTCNLVAMYGIESTDEIVKAMRLVSIPKDLISVWHDNWKIALSTIDFSNGYKKWCADLKNNYSTGELWDRGVYVGKMGE